MNNPSFRLNLDRSGEGNGEILVIRNHSIVYVKRGFLDKLEMTIKD